MKRAGKILDVLFILLIVGCSGQPPSKSFQADTAHQDTNTAAPSTGFRVNLALSDAAKRRLLENKESIIVAGYFTGSPKHDALKKYVDEMGEVGLGNVQAEVAPGENASFKEINLKSDALEQIDEQGPLLLINVYSGRKSSKNNLLDCGIYQGPLKSVQGKNIPIACKLIGE